MSNLGTVPGAGQPWRQQYDFNTELSPDSLTWTIADPLPSTIDFSQAIVTKNRIYLLGKYINDNGSNIVYTAPINEDGTLGDWTTATPLPNTVYDSQVIIAKNRVYLLGGRNGSTWLNTVYTAPINEDGTLGIWTTARSLPATVVDSHAIVTKNRVYLISGYINGFLSETVYTSIINEDGTLGDWVIANSLPVTVRSSQAIVTRNRVYLLGGIINGRKSSLVYTAPINEDGTLENWVTDNPLPGTVVWSQSIVTRNRIYVLGGCINDNDSSIVYTAPINEDGIIGEWAVTNPLPKTVEFSQAVVVKNKAYMLGGFISDCFSNTVFVTDLPGGLNDYSEFY